MPLPPHPQLTQEQGDMFLCRTHAEVSNPHDMIQDLCQKKTHKHIAGKPCHGLAPPPQIMLKL